MPERLETVPNVLEAYAIDVSEIGREPRAMLVDELEERPYFPTALEYLDSNEVNVS